VSEKTLDSQILPDEAIDPPQATISAAMTAKDKHMLILAPPGSGKSTAAFVCARTTIEKEEPFLYVANNRTDLGESTSKLVAAITNPDILSPPVTLAHARAIEKKIFVLQSGRKKLAEGEQVDGKSTKLGDTTKFIFTHKTYLERKGLAPVFYPLLRWIQREQPAVIADEINDFVTACSRLIPIEIAATIYRPAGATRAKRRWQFRCPGYKTRSYRCLHCDQRKAKSFEVDEYGNARIRFPGGFVGDDADLRTAPDWSVFEIVRKVEVPDCNFDILYIRQNAHNQYTITEEVKSRYEDDEYFQGVDDLRHLIEYSYEPAFLVAYPVLVTSDNGVQQLIPLREETQRKGLLEVTDGIPVSYDGRKLPARSYIKMPSHGCGTYLHLIDTYPLRILKEYASSVRFLTTQRNSETIEILKSVFPELATVEAPSKATRLEGVFIVGFGGKLNQEKMVAGLIEEQTKYKALQFEPCDSDAKRAFLKTPATAKVSMYCSGEQLQRRKYTMCESQALIVNSFGALGKAVDLLEFDICVVNANINKPLIAGARYADKAKIIEMHRRHRLEMIDQNSGRIRRGQGRKVILVHGLTQSEFGELLRMMKLEESFNSITSVYVADSGVIATSETVDEKVLSMTEESVYKSIIGYLADNAIMFAEKEKSKLKKDGMSKRQRIERKEEIKAAKAAKKVARARKILLDGGTVRSVNRALHLTRLPVTVKCEFWAKVYDKKEL
jgi:hypothetical protein